MMPRGQNKLGSYLEIIFESAEKSPATEADDHSASFAARRLQYAAASSGFSKRLLQGRQVQQGGVGKDDILATRVDEAIWLEIFKFDYHIILRGNWLCFLCFNHYKRPSFRAIFNTPEQGNANASYLR